MSLVNPSRAALRATLRPAFVRPSKAFSSSVIKCNSAQTLARENETVAVTETEDIKELDQLLKSVKARSNPEHNAFMPMRGSISWAQTLLDSARKKESPAPSKTTLPQVLTPRSMHDSYTEIFLPFETSPELLEQYTNASGGIRTDRLMEHLDSLAGSIAYKHMLGGDVETLGANISERGFYIVTAAVDRLDMLAPLYPVRDLRISGHVIHVGNSSMEIVVKMEALKEGSEEKTLMLGRFSMVCRDAFTHRAHPVNPLKVITPEEQALHNIGELHKRRRQTQAKRSLSKVPPTSVEAEALHSFILEHGSEDQDNAQRVWMGDTKLERTMMMFPQERNLHQKIFGGYLMRLAYELGFTNSRLFTREPVRFLSLDNISFAKPVSIGSILRLTSHILHTTSSEQFPAIVHVRVLATVVDVASGDEEITNDFRFTWCREEGAPLPRRVVPKTYAEAMLWLEGKRALDMRATIEGLRTSKSAQSSWSL